MVSEKDNNIVGFSIDIARFTGKSSFFKDNFEHFSATGSAKQSPDDFNNRKVQCAQKVQ